MKEYIHKHFGTIVQCARELDVTTQTVQNWIQKNPRGILKHAPEILKKYNTTYLELEGEVLHSEDAIKLGGSTLQD